MVHRRDPLLQEILVGFIPGIVVIGPAGAAVTKAARRRESEAKRSQGAVTAPFRRVWRGISEFCNFVFARRADAHKMAAAITWSAVPADEEYRLF